MAKTNTVIVTLDDLERSVRFSDRAPRLSCKQLGAATRLTMQTLALATLGRQVNLNLGNGYQLECRVSAVPTTTTTTAGAAA